MSLKYTEELCVMTMKNNAKFEEQLTCCFKIDSTIWQILTWSIQCHKNFHFDEFFLNKVNNVWAKKVEELYFMAMKSDAQCDKNRLSVWKMTWGIRQIFTRALESLRIGALMGYFYPK